MQIVIKIPEEYHKAIMEIPVEQSTADMLIIRNGTPLDKHDEEVIKETVESIWGKPPYTELLENIRAEIEKLNPVDYGSIYSYESHYGAKEMQNDVLEIIDKYAESEET